MDCTDFVCFSKVEHCNLQCRQSCQRESCQVYSHETSASDQRLGICVVGEHLLCMIFPPQRVDISKNIIPAEILSKSFCSVKPSAVDFVNKDHLGDYQLTQRPIKQSDGNMRLHPQGQIHTSTSQLGPLDFQDLKQTMPYGMEVVGTHTQYILPRRSGPICSGLKVVGAHLQYMHQKQWANA